MAEKFFYNGMLFPEIPSDMQERYPYYWIRKNENTEHYDLLFTRTIGYYDSEVNGIVYGPNAATTEVVHFRLAFSKVKVAEDWDRYQITTTWVALDENRTILWSNHNIPEGSLTATEVHFIGSSPIPDMESYQIKKETLVGIADQVRRLCETEENMTPKQMREKLSSLTNDDVAGGSGGGWDDGWVDGDNPVPGFSQRTTQVFVDDSVTKVAPYVFYEYEGLNAVSFPAAETIGYRAFYRCENLETAEFPAVKEVDDEAFYECSSLNACDFSQAESIGKASFYYTGLEEADAPLLTEIPSRAFSGCQNLAVVNFPKVEVVGYQALAACAFTNIDLPAAHTLDGRAFASCESLRTISAPNVRTIGTSAFDYCSSLTSVSFPLVTNCESYAFKACTNLRSFYLPSLTTLGYGAFSGCSSLTEAHLSAPTRLEWGTFGACSSLTRVTLDNVTSIGETAFTGCTSLREVRLGANTVCALGRRVFQTSAVDEKPCSNFTIYVPTSLVEAYKANSEWNKLITNGCHIVGV